MNTDARFAAELRYYARMLDDPFADTAKVARLMKARANALTPRSASVLTWIEINGRRVGVLKRRRAAFAL
jgi:hypothetical protein